MHLQIPKEQSSAIMAFMDRVVGLFPDLPSNEVTDLLNAEKGISIEIKPLRYNRTRQQERYYRKWAAEFAKFTGNTPDEVHEYMLCECYGSDVVQTKLGIRPRPRKRSGDTSREQYSELIETLIRTAAGLGFVVPPPLREMNYEHQED